jgi:NAD-dependent dihydropyrimidine dehydrogenase PreA subunit/flavodoxin
MNRKINAIYFSATGTTEKVVCQTADKIADNMKNETAVNKINFTLPAVRKEAVSFTEEDLVIIGVPVYAGRVPNVLLNYLNSIQGNGALAVPVVLYGNRHYDDALIELKDILEASSFKVIAGGAFIGEHAFSRILGKDRPDEKDSVIINDFADKIFFKITNGDKLQPVEVKGNRPYRNYYMPKNREGIPVNIRKVTPKTNGNCIDCKLCAQLCPMGSIDYEDVSKFNGICIKCGACIKNCPVEAKYYDDEDYLRHKQELEIDFASRKEPEFFI